MQGEEVSLVHMVGTHRAMYEPGCLEFPPRFPLQQLAFWLLTAAHGLVSRDGPEMAPCRKNLERRLKKGQLLTTKLETASEWELVEAPGAIHDP